MAWICLNRIFSIVTLIYFTSPFKQGEGQVTNISLKNFEREILNVQCPKVDICNPNATSADLQPKGDIGFGTVSCCTSCSCHPDCEKQKNCCFPDEESLSSDDTEFNLFDCLSTHMVPPGKDRRGDVPAYKTIVQPPPGGCVTSKPVKLGPNEEISPTCDESYLPIFGSYYPVYSADTDLIYKNSLCALCHGAAKMTQFVPLLICEKENFEFTLPVELDVFESGTLSPRCIIDFRFPGPALISKHRCYKEIVNTCESTRLNVMRGIQPLDIETVLSLCENSLYSPTALQTKVYRNAFCILCASNVVRPNDCRMDDSGGRSSGGSLIHIMDPRKLKAHLSISPGEQRHPEVCLSNKVPQVKRSCRRLFCSSGKLRNANGDCEFITSKWVSGLSYITVMLTEIEHDDSFPRTHQIIDAENILQIFQEKTPWPDSWKINTIHRMKERPGCKMGRFVVDFLTETEDIEQLYTDVDTSIKAMWSIKIDGSAAMYRQSWGVLPKDSGGCEPNYSSLILVYEFGRMPDASSIKKLLLCQQIELAPSEYRIDYPTLHSNLTRRVLLGSEYVQLEAGRVRVCIEDTIFSLSQTSDTLGIGSQMIIIVFSLMIAMLFS